MIKLFPLPGAIVTTFKVSSVQFQHRANDKTYNLGRIEFFTQQAVLAGSQLVAFPEMCICGYWHVPRLDDAALNEAVTHHGWPTLAQSRGKVVFLLDPVRMAAIYREGHPSLAGRVLFTNSKAGEPDGAFIEVNDPDVAEIGKLVHDGYLVRTRTDDGTVEARHNDTRRRDTALASGAQIISTDYPGAEPASTGFKVELPGGLPARCNPVNAPAVCRDAQVNEH